LVPVELIVDHSVQVDYFGTQDCRRQNVAKEYQRNGERYALLKWAQKSFENFMVVPPNSGICHQVNLEHLGRVIITDQSNGTPIAYPDSLVGLDSHTTMINAIGVMGWGVGGIEAEAVMLGQPYYMAVPEVIGVELTGQLPEGATATDLVLRVTQMLREYKVVEKFVEFFGPGMKRLTVPDRATIANMSPEYGATMGFFPVDEKTLEYLDLTGRSDRVPVVEAAAKALGLFYTGEETPEYTDVLSLDLGDVRPAVAGPARPQDRIELVDLKERFGVISKQNYPKNTTVKHESRFNDEGGASSARPVERWGDPDSGWFPVDLENGRAHIRDGSVVIAAITSCTNTSNPSVLIGAGLLAKKAVEKGLHVPLHVKTSLAPGSKVVVRYLEDAGLMPYFEALGFHLAAFGCTTCIGNSGPIHPDIERAIIDHNLTAASVLSGNRNFEARIHQKVKANFLASPMLVVAFALAGRVDIDPAADPLTYDPNGRPVFLKELWPAREDIDRLVGRSVKRDDFVEEYGRILDGDRFWHDLPDAKSTTFPWDPESTYIKQPPFFDEFRLEPEKPGDVTGARVLMRLGDSVTTDHISPAGAIPPDYPAGLYLIENGVDPSDFNSYGSRRGNHEVMMRGTFGNIRIKNALAGDREGSWTVKFPENEPMRVYDAAMRYQAEGTPLIVLGGKEYGSGSSRDWAAKGTDLLGVKAVIAQSYERIHRSNLIGMGVLPLVFQGGQNADTLGLDGTEIFTITGVADVTPRRTLKVIAEKPGGDRIEFEAVARLDTDIEVDYYQNGGILKYVLRKMMTE
jgi:aconitate hydratase